MAYRPSPLKSIRGILRDAPTLAVALPEAERMRELNRRFAGVVPAAVARACRVVAIQDGTALLHCANGAAASRVRSQASGIARALSSRAPGRPTIDLASTGGGSGDSSRPVLAVKVKVRADWTLPEKREKAGLGNAALSAFRELDAQLPECDLKAAVDALLSRRRG